MARLLAADIEAVLAHMFEHVAVADGRALERQADALKMPLQPEIGHDGGDDAGPGEPPLVAPALRHHGHQLIAIDHMPLLVDDEHAIRIAIERDAEIGPHFLHLAHQRIGRGGADLAIDVEPVRLDADRNDFRAELPERFGRDLVGGAIRAIDDDAQAGERNLARQGALGEFDIARPGRFDAFGAAERLGLGEMRRHVGVDQFLDLALDGVGELEPVRPEELDAVILVEIVRGGDHHADIGPHRARHHGDGGGRNRAEQEHVHADGEKPGGQRLLDHVAGQARILADHDAMAVIAVREDDPRRLADAQREFRGDLPVSGTAYAIGAEILARHAMPRRLGVNPLFTNPDPIHEIVRSAYRRG
jgi:hypothetical protein